MLAQPAIKKVQYWSNIWVYWNEKNRVIFKSYKLLPLILRRSYKQWKEAAKDRFLAGMDYQQGTASVLINFATYWANIALEAGTSFQTCDGYLLIGGIQVYLNTPVNAVLDQLRGRIDRRPLTIPELEEYAARL